MKHIVLGILFVLGWHSWGEAQVYPVQVFGEFFYHRAAIDGTVQWSEAEVLGTEIDLDGTFGLEQCNGFGGKAGLVLYGAHEIVLDYRRYALSEDTTLSTSLRFGDISLPARLPVSPSLLFQSVGVFYGYRIVNGALGFFSIRPGVELVNYEVGVEAELFGYELLSETYSEKHTVPFFWVVGETKLHPVLSLAGELSGGKIEDRVAYWGQALVKFTLHPNFAAHVGYSRVWFEDTTGENLFDISLSGIVFGGQMSM